MHALQFNYLKPLADVVMDSYTFAAGVDLYLRGIHTIQRDSCTLEFESDRDRTYALLFLSTSGVYTVSALDDSANKFNTTNPVFVSTL